MFAVQHHGRLLGDWVTLSRYPTLSEATDSAKRIITPWAGGDSRSDGQKRLPEDYRIVETNKLGHTRGIYDTDGNPQPIRVAA